METILMKMPIAVKINLLLHEESAILTKVVWVVIYLSHACCSLKSWLCMAGYMLVCLETSQVIKLEIHQYTIHINIIKFTGA